MNQLRKIAKEDTVLAVNRAKLTKAQNEYNKVNKDFNRVQEELKNKETEKDKMIAKMKKQDTFSYKFLNKFSLIGIAIFCAGFLVYIMTNNINFANFLILGFILFCMGGRIAEYMEGLDEKLNTLNIEIESLNAQVQKLAYERQSVEARLREAKRGGEQRFNFNESQNKDSEFRRSFMSDEIWDSEDIKYEIDLKTGVGHRVNETEFEYEERMEREEQERIEYEKMREEAALAEEEERENEMRMEIEEEERRRQEQEEREREEEEYADMLDEIYEYENYYSDEALEEFESI